MNTLTAYVISAAAVLALAALLSWWAWGPNRLPLIVYVIGVAIAWMVVLGIAWLTGGRAQFNTFALVCAGFALGMLAMYIALQATILIA